MMEHGETMLWSTYIEKFAARYCGFDRADERYYDGVGADGTKWEVKACRRRIGGGSRRGRWWVERSAHTTLRTVGGRYALIVYDPDADDGPIIAIETIDADALDDELDGLKWCSTGGHAKGDEARLITWSNVIDPDEVVEPEPDATPVSAVVGGAD